MAALTIADEEIMELDSTFSSASEMDVDEIEVDDKMEH